MDYVKIANDMKILGPGYWVHGHAKTIRMNTREKALEYPKFVRELCELLRCYVCTDHCRQFMVENPPDDPIYLEMCTVAADGKEYVSGPFFHFWNFHNAVNLRLGKQVISFADAYRMYDPFNFIPCNDDCGK